MVIRHDSEGGAAFGHHPDRPSWDCVACGKPWPCDPAREHLARRLDAVGLAMYAWNRLEEAVGDLPYEPAGELFERFLAWTRQPGAR